jgi:pimeloyl-ACP methyl ester carboxylesterase
MLLLHGLGDCAANWERFGAAMSADYRVVAPDLRGHGDSQRSGDAAYGLRDHVADVEAVVDRLALGRMVLVGHALGGRIAVAYAAAHPDAVAAVCIVDSDVSGRPRRMPAIADGVPGWESLDAVAEHLRRLQPDATHQALADQALRLTVEGDDGRRSWKADPAALAPGAAEDLWAELRRLQGPTLFLRGRQSQVMPHGLAVRMREAVPGARLAELEGAGHWVHQEIPGACEATVRWFLEDPP